MHIFNISLILIITIDFILSLVKTSEIALNIESYTPTFFITLPYFSLLALPVSPYLDAAQIAIYYFDRYGITVCYT